MKTILVVSTLLFILAACSSSATPVTPVMPLPTETAAFGQPGPNADVPPETAWNGIPIMPGATAGEGDPEGYVFTIQAEPGQVQEFYEIELGKLGWQLAGQESNATTLALLFTNSASETLTINIVSKDGQALVLLAKQG